MTDTVTTPLVIPVTRANILALKHADSVVFRLHRGQATIEAIKREDRSLTGFEQKVSIYCSATITDYSAGTSWVAPENLRHFEGFEMSMSAQYDHDLRTLITRIRPEDTLTLAWTRGNTNEANRRIGWVRDELRLVITNPKGKKETYLVEVRVGPDDSARMVKRSL